MRWQDRFIKEKNRFFKGYGEITSFRYFILMYPILDLWLRARGIEIKIVPIIVFVLMTLFGFWLIGYVWDKSHLYNAEQEFMNNRNDMLMRIEKRLKKLESKRFK